MRVEDITTGCDTTFTVDVLDNYTVEEIDNITTTAVTSCGSANGSLEVTSMTNGDALSDYTFYWYSEGYDTGLPPDNPANAALEITDVTSRDQDLTAQLAGTYWVVAQHKSTLCYSIPQQRSIADNTPSINILAETENKPFITCTDLNEGSLKVPAQGSTGNYDFYWYIGRKQDLMVSSTSFASSTSATETDISGLTGGILYVDRPRRWRCRTCLRGYCRIFCAH